MDSTALIRLKQFGSNDILTMTWSIFRDRFQTIVAIWIIIFIPINILINQLPLRAADRTPGLVLCLGLVQVILTYIGASATLALAHVVEGHIHDRNYTYWDALSHGFSRLPTFIGTSVIGGLILAGLFLLLVVPAIAWAVYYMFFAFVVALRDRGGKEALDYSKRLVEGQWWRIFRVTLELAVIPFAFGFGIGLVQGLLPESNFLNVAVDSLVSLMEVFFIIATAVFFLNVDYRRNPRKEEQLEADASAA